MKTSRLSHRIRAAGLTVWLALVSFACNPTGPETLAVHGTWAGSVAELQLELTMVLIDQGETGILGIAEMTSLATGMVHGEVSGTRDGPDVGLTIEIDGAIVAGSLVFEGEFQGEDTITGTLSGGLLEGSWPIAFEREEV